MEKDTRPVADQLTEQPIESSPKTPSPLNASAIEVLRPDLPRGGFRAVLFDFDGTLSLIRRNWQAVMIPMMVEVLAETGTSETGRELFEHVEEFVMRLNGRQTIYQMIHLAKEVAARGGQPLDPLEYKRRYHQLLWRQVGGRVAALEEGRATPEEMSVPGAHRFLARLADQGLQLYLASGTDLAYVQNEVRQLKMDAYFGPHVYGALDRYQDFSKAKVIAEIIRDMAVSGRELLAFGDGFVEIEEVRAVGGVAVGVASEEERREGINAGKRERLIRAGADLIIGDYRCQNELVKLLGVEPSPQAPA